MPKAQSALPEKIERAILLLRDAKVMLDKDIAALYGVETKVLVQECDRQVTQRVRGIASSVGHGAGIE